MTQTSVAYDADPNTNEFRIERSRDAVASALSTLKTTRPSGRARHSPIAELLEPYADDIRELMAAGHSAGAIARKMRERGVKFETDSIRLRIAKMFAAQRSTKPGISQAPPVAPKRRHSAGSSASLRTNVAIDTQRHAGHGEDAQ